MTDPGWDIPGVTPRDRVDSGVPSDAHGSASSAPASSAYAEHVSSSTADSRARQGKPGRKTRTSSVSACSGLSAGAFARLADGGTPAVASSAGSPDNDGENFDSTES